MKSYVSDNGLPRAVKTASDLPANAYVGYVCEVESGDGAGPYVFNGTEYDAISISGDSGGGETATDYVAVPTHTSISGATDPLPADAPEGSLSYVKGSVHAPYIKTNSAWVKLNAASTNVILPTVADTDHYPANPDTGQMVWLTGTGPQIYNGSAWKTISLET